MIAELPADLRTGLEAETVRAPEERMAQSVTRLIEAYRSGRPATAPILTSGMDVAAYAAYRMPATFAAVRSALAQIAQALPEFGPRSQLDVGGGTGAAAWAAADAFPGLSDITVLDQVADALGLGKRLASRAGSPALRQAAWQQWQAAQPAELPGADLVTLSYVLGELTEQAQAALTARLLGAAKGLLLVIEPGTPAGYQRILRVRQAMLDHGLTIVAPCPHQAACPLAEVPGDWCHFAARVNRSALHRRLKSAQLGHEDEKFSFIAAAPADVPLRPAARVLRHPQFRKGMVTMQLCRADDTVRPQIVSKKEGPLYREARDVEWGAAWPPDPRG
ncbi:small ribosomal subunit Rsm22 family protein [Actinoplanes sp. N902-109]|uniref:small ribosomal subunit Rsm22 family protein n=1 Tax=Actinoplanes sp. (strain N902-109) TaxID=649831 RepID=UPI00032949A5|nr:small ribosomal subunit Rsm22 family protein [Actinoplanes sp. N902-109]AGL14614.1 Ribosomal small subunit Rsm22 [Actinoplanes sp. N902-109]